MLQRVVFLEDGSVTAKRLKRAVVAAGHICLEASSEKVLREHIAAGANLILHIPSDPRRFVSILTRLQLDFPCLPVLHIMEESLFQPAEWLKGPLHEWLTITAPVDGILRKIETLTYFARMESEFKTSVETGRRLENFTREIRGIETSSVILRAGALLKDEFEADNVIWFPDDLLHRELELHVRNRGLVTAPLRLPRAPSWISLNDLGPDGLQSLFESWCTLTASSGAINAEPVEMYRVSVDSEYDVIVPIQPFQGSGQPYGHLVLVRPRAWRRLQGTRHTSALFDLLSQQLSETTAYERLRAMTYKDDLTDLYNQRYLPLVLQQELERASRQEQEFSVLFLDVDYFKSVNDTKGHLVGSAVLVELSKLFRASIRRTDYAFRYGGDEYVIVLSGADTGGAALVAERLRQKTANSTFMVNGDQVNITVSIGIATYPEHAKSTEELLNMADEAMYDGKHKSRNIVSVAS